MESCIAKAAECRKKNTNTKKAPAKQNINKLMNIHFTFLLKYLVKGIAIQLPGHLFQFGAC